MERDPILTWHAIIAGALLGSLAIFLVDLLDGPLGIVPAIVVVAVGAALLAAFARRRLGR